MKVLQVITDTDRRGAQVFAIDLSGALEQLGHDVTTVAMTQGKQRRPLDVDVLGPSRYSTRTLARLRRLMKRADTTIGHGSDTLVACAVAGLGPGRQFVYRQIGDVRFWSDTRWKRLRVGGLLRMARSVVALSSRDAVDLVEHLRVPPARITVVPNGVRPDAFGTATAGVRAAARRQLKVPEGDVAVLQIGALVPEKGVELSIRAISVIPGTHLVVVGDGEDLPRLQALADQLAPDRVTFAGPLDDPLAAYSASDLVVLPSLTEGMPATLIEAGLCGLPAIASSVGSIGDVVRDGVTGALVPPGELPPLVHALSRLREDAELRSMLGSAAIEHCRTSFGIEHVASSWVDVLEGTIGARIGPRRA